jgi:RNA polymerase sigma-70 factor (ECF subfamily)
MTHKRGELPPRDSEVSDEKLMLRAGQGDRAAFDEIVRRYTRRMINLGYQMTGDRELAQDIAQETFLRAYRSASRYREIAKFSTWLYTIAINLCRNELRRRKHRMLSLEGLADRDEDKRMRIDIADESRTPDREVESKEMGRLIREAVAELPERFRSPLVLRDIQGLSYEEIGGILDLPAGTVKSRINRARLRVKEQLKPVFGEDRSGGDETR